MKTLTRLDDVDSVPVFDVEDDAKIQDLREDLYSDLPEELYLDLLNVRFHFKGARERMGFAQGLEAGRILSIVA